jgi:hypothetical protein
MPVQVELLQYRDDGKAAALQSRSRQEVLTGLATLHSCNSQILADGLRRLRRDRVRQAQYTAGPLNPLPLSGVAAWVLGLTPGLSWPQPANGGVDSRFETSSLPSRRLPPCCRSAYPPISLLDARPHRQAA